MNRTNVERTARRWFGPNVTTRGEPRPTGTFVAEVWDGPNLLAVAESNLAGVAWQRVLDQLQEKRK